MKLILSHSKKITPTPKQLSSFQPTAAFLGYPIAPIMKANIPSMVSFFNGEKRDIKRPKSFTLAAVTLTSSKVRNTLEKSNQLSKPFRFDNSWHWPLNTLGWRNCSNQTEYFAVRVLKPSASLSNIRTWSASHTFDLYDNGARKELFER